MTYIYAEVDFNREVCKSLGIVDHILKLFLDVGGCQVLRGIGAYPHSFFLKICSQTLLLKAVFGLEQCSSSCHARILFFLRFSC